MRSAMKKYGVRRLLVSGDSGQLHGIVSLDDLLGALVHEMSDLAAAARNSIECEAVQRPPLASVQPSPVRVPEYSFQ